MEKIRPHFPNVADVLHVPNVHAVILVHAGEPVTAGVEDNSNSVWIGGIRPSGKHQKVLLRGGGKGGAKESNVLDCNFHKNLLASLGGKMPLLAEKWEYQ